MYQKPENFIVNLHDVLNAVCYMELQVCLFCVDICRNYTCR